MVSKDRVGAGDGDTGGGTGGTGGGCKCVGDSTPSKNGEREIRLLEVASSLSSSGVCCTKTDRYLSFGDDDDDALFLAIVIFSCVLRGDSGISTSCAS